MKKVRKAVIPVAGLGTRFLPATNMYGIVGKGEEVGAGFVISAMVEKPAPALAPSNYYINGRYLLQPEVFAILRRQEPGAGREILLTDAMLRLLAEQPFFAVPFEGRMYDCGSKEGFVQANVAFALARNDIRDRVFHPIAAMMSSLEPRVAAE